MITTINSIIVTCPKRFCFNREGPVKILRFRRTTVRRPKDTVATAIATQTALVSAIMILCKTNIIESVESIRQMPKNRKTPNRMNGNVKNNADEYRFLLAIVPYTKEFPGIELKASW